MIVLSAVLWPFLEAPSDEYLINFSSSEVGGEGVWLHYYPARIIHVVIGEISSYFYYGKRDPTGLLYLYKYVNVTRVIHPTYL